MVASQMLGEALLGGEKAPRDSRRPEARNAQIMLFEGLRYSPRAHREEEILLPPFLEEKTEVQSEQMSLP